MTIPDYRKATNAAYKLLAQKDIIPMSTNLFSVIEDYLPDCRLITYSQAAFLYGNSTELLLQASEYGFSVVRGNRRLILYNESLPFGCVRFTIAHEIGHAILGHVDEFSLAAEREANCFARNLLCPIPIVCALDFTMTDEYTAAFDVTQAMAIVALDKRSVDRYYIAENLYDVILSKFETYLDGLDAYQYRAS